MLGQQSQHDRPATAPEEIHGKEAYKKDATQKQLCRLQAATMQQRARAWQRDTEPQQKRSLVWMDLCRNQQEGRETEAETGRERERGRKQRGGSRGNPVSFEMETVSWRVASCCCREFCSAVVVLDCWALQASEASSGRYHPQAWPFGLE